MAIDIILPSLSAGMEEAVLSKWLVRPGDMVAEGQVIAEVETDKATMELEAEAGGIVGRLEVEDGARVEVGRVIAVLVGDGEAPLPAPAPVASPAPVSSPASTSHPPASADPAPSPGGPSRPASPLARRLAAAAGLDLDLAQLAGSGPKGRIVKIDVERALAAAPSTVAPTPSIAPAPIAASPAAAPTSVPNVPIGLGPYDEIPHTNVRRVIARRLVEAKQTVPHFYLSCDCELDALETLRAQINAGRDKAAKISVNDFVVKAAARALRRVPDANVVWTDERMLRLLDVDVSVAVAVEGGLLTPILRGADRMSLGTLSAEMKALAARAREGKLKPEEYQGGGFSVSNLGMYGVTSFSAIVNPPQSCILAVGAAERRPVVRGDRIEIARVMTVTLSVDHRAVDGALGAQLLAAFKNGVEDPMSLLV